MQTDEVLLSCYFDRNTQCTKIIMSLTDNGVIDRAVIAAQVVITRADVQTHFLS